jgi:hypothetical protein
MRRDTRREFKDRLYGQFARIGQSAVQPPPMEILELLASSKWTVDSLATEIGVSLDNTSQHLHQCRG